MLFIFNLFIVTKWLILNGSVLCHFLLSLSPDLLFSSLSLLYSPCSICCLILSDSVLFFNSAVTSIPTSGTVSQESVFIFTQRWYQRIQSVVKDSLNSLNPIVCVLLSPQTSAPLNLKPWQWLKSVFFFFLLSEPFYKWGTSLRSWFQTVSLTLIIPSSIGKLCSLYFNMNEAPANPQLQACSLFGIHVLLHGNISLLFESSYIFLKFLFLQFIYNY